MVATHCKIIESCHKFKIPKLRGVFLLKQEGWIGWAVMLLAEVAGVLALAVS